MVAASVALRDQIATHMEEALKECQNTDGRIHELFKIWLENREDYKVTREVADELVPLLEGKDCPHAQAILDLKDHLVKRSQWILVVMVGHMILDMVVLTMLLQITKMSIF